MGCDIHPAIEYRAANEPWQAVLIPNRDFGKWDGEEEMTARIDIGRDYDLFAMLGNVRNGSGFAGVKTGEGYVPMSDSRGVPEDISPEALKALSDEHSATWVTLSEILAYDWTRTAKHQGWVNPGVFAEWDRKREWEPAPKSWSGQVSGAGVKLVSNDAMRQALKDDPELAKDSGMFAKSGLYTVVEWTTTYAEDAKQLWNKILPVMLPLGNAHGFDNVRLVMDFDS